MKSPNLTTSELSTCQGEVLLVEDDETLREAAAEVLRMAGFDVTTASNGAEALQQLARGPVGVILLDLRMPVLDGWAFLRHRACDPTLSATPVVILSAEAMDPALATTVSAWLGKPCDEASLVEAVAAAMANRGRSVRRGTRAHS